ncbi:MAG: hypothetical protein RL095_1936 [Verrucomicrobiota bacterium]|jgi:hypothetical protein
MSTPESIPGLRRGAQVPPQALTRPPPEAADASRLSFYGAEGEGPHFLYDVPAVTPIAKVITAFAAGSAGGREDLSARLAIRATRLNQRLPCRIEQIDPGHLTLVFLQPLSDSDLAFIGEIFLEDRSVHSGLSYYHRHWDSGREKDILSPVRREQRLCLCWE